MTARDEGSPAADAKHVRLSVNVSNEAAAALKKIADDHGWTITEAVRRLIALGRFVYDEDQAGNRLLLDDGARMRKVELLP